jgi:hypothetical protein
MGVVGAAAWIVIHYRRMTRWSMFPVFWLSGTMLLYQNINALYLLYPARPKYINMHHVFWVLFAFMALYALVARPQPVKKPSDDVDRGEPRFRWERWMAGAAAGLVLVIYLAGYVNNDTTMATANTRWPIWSWSDGPFPGRSVRP